MKKVFTLALVMALAITTFAQTRSMSRPSVKDIKTAETRTFNSLSFEEANVPFSPITPKSVMTVDPDVTQLPFLVNDWWTGQQQKNWTAVWPDGFAVNCFEIGQDASSSLADNGTGLAWYDPAIGEWDFNTERFQDEKATSHSVARYKENGIVVVSQSNYEVHVYINEDFRNNPDAWEDTMILPLYDADNSYYFVPVVQCSGPNLDIIHILYYDYYEESAGKTYYARYENGEWTEIHKMLDQINGDRVGGTYTNCVYFMLYDPAHPNRVSFISNGSWRDGLLVISEDNGQTWTERMFYQHPGVHTTYSWDDTLTGGTGWIFIPRMTSAAFDYSGNLHMIYEWNGTIGEPGGGSYYPSVGGVSYWSETLPKSDLCIGGVGDPGQPFIMDNLYLVKDLYESEWYWSDALHDPVPEYIGELEQVDGTQEHLGEVVPRDDENGIFPPSSEWRNHGDYNQGKAGYPTMFYDKATGRIFAFWSMICGDAEHELYVTDGLHLLRLFGAYSFDGGNTWDTTKQILTGFDSKMCEMIYNQVVPYVYSDDEGEFIWVCYNNDFYPGAYYWDEDPVAEDNSYRAIKIYIDYLDTEDAPTFTVAKTMEVYPNPAQGTFNIDLNYESDVNIYNTVGQLVKTLKNVKSASVSLESGVYFVNANNQTKKVVVK